MITKALENYNDATGIYPHANTGITLLKESLHSEKKPYLLTTPIDPWGNEYFYQYPGVHNKTRYDVWSLGADKKKGGINENKDITNW